jgi:hypothetical protein
MIRNKTLFVLGAGASSDFGYPLFKDLHAVIAGWNINQLPANIQGLARKWSECHTAAQQHFPHKYDSFIGKYRASTARTIDEFLSHPSNEPYRDIAIYMITYVIRSSEDSSALLSSLSNWYSELANHMGRDLNETLESQCAFVTFNYDRTLEWFFYNRFKNFFSTSHAEAVEAVRKLRIWHVHGCVGGVDFGNDSYQFNAKDTVRLFHDVGNIFTVGNGSTSPPSNVEEIMWEARTNVFLGFGFHVPNLQKLNVDWANPNKHYYSTCKGMTTDQRDFASQACQNAEIRFDDSLPDCYSFVSGRPSLFR